MNRIRNCNLQPFFEEVRAIKTALFLNEWIEHVPVCELEESYNTMAGQILTAADQTGWLIDATAAIATALGTKNKFVDRIKLLSERVQRGLRPELFPIARLTLPGLTRNVLTTLAAQNLHTPEALSTAPLQILKQWMPESAARGLKTWANAQITPPTSTPEPQPLSLKPILIVDDNRPGEILLKNIPIALQDKQYRLIRVLAAYPGVCVPYDTIYDAVWGKVIVEPNQMHFQKRKLIAAIAAAGLDHPDLIRTIPKHGFTLGLAPEHVLLVPLQTVRSAA